MSIYRSNLTQEYLKSILHYDPKTGLWRWTVPKIHRDLSKPAGSPENGYLIIVIDCVNYRAHRLAFLYMTGAWPEKDVDHKDLNRSNNKWENLREADDRKNQGNQNAYLNNKSGYKGVSWDKKAKKWKAQIGMNGKRINLGRFEKIEDASFAYEEAAINYFKEFARF